MSNPTDLTPTEVDSSEPFPTRQLMTMAAPYNANQMDEWEFDILSESMTINGCIENIVVNRRSEEMGWPEDSKPIIVSGHQRVRAAGHIGLATVPVVWVDKTEVGEMALNAQMNRTKGHDDPDQVARNFQEMIEKAAETGDKMLTGYTAEEIEAHIGPTDLPPMPDLSKEETPSFKEPDEDAKVECPSCGYKWN